MLILDNGDVIVDSYVIVEYLDELAGGGKLIPASGPTRWKVKSDHSLIQGMLDSMLLCRYEKMVRPQGLQWQAWSDDHWNRAWNGMARFEKQPEMLSRPARHLADRPRLRARLCRFPLRRLRLAQGLSEARCLPPEDAGAALGKDLGAAAGVTTKSETAACARTADNCGASASLPFSLLAGSIATGTRPETSPACGTPTALDDGWTIASPESVGLDSARLCAIAARLKETDANVHAVVIVRHGKLVFEQYFSGPDERWDMWRDSTTMTRRPGTTCARHRRA